jgi:hypothetical protein
MIFKNWFKRKKNSFNKLDPENDKNKYLLNLLEDYEISTPLDEFKDKLVYTISDKYKLLGVYSYPDIDINQTGIVVRSENGSLIKLDKHTILFINKPPEWVKHLKWESKIEYSRDQFVLSQDDLFNKYYKLIPNDIIRDMKIEEILKNK